MRMFIILVIYLIAITYFPELIDKLENDEDGFWVILVAYALLAGLQDIMEVFRK